jgi:hypothetical protein
VGNLRSRQSRQLFFDIFIEKKALVQIRKNSFDVLQIKGALTNFNFVQIINSMNSFKMDFSNH